MTKYFTQPDAPDAAGPAPLPGLDLGPSAMPTASPEGGIDLGADTPAEPVPPAPSLSEKNILSIRDDEAPIKAQKSLKLVSDFLSEKNNDDDKTEFEDWQQKERTKTKIKNNKARKTDKLGLMPNMSSTYQRTREQNKPDGLKREYDKLRRSYTYRQEDMLNEEDFDISEYLDMKITQNGKLTNRIKSTLKRFDNNIKSEKSVISENNSSGEKNDKT